MRSKSTCLFFVTIFLASCAAPTATQTSEVLTPTPTSTPAPVMRIVVTPGAPIAELPSSAEIDSSNAALPQWIIGNFEAMGLPDDLEPTTWDSAKYASVRQHGLVPVLEDGTIASYKRDNGLVYAPILAQISSEDGAVLSANGGVQPGGIMEYVSADGAVKRYVRVGIACPEGSDCLPAVRYVGEDAGGFYLLMLDKNTGEIIAYSPAVTEDKPGRATWLPVGDRWSSALSGPTALQAGEGYGIDYRRSVDGATNIFYFAAGDKEYQAKDREIHYTPTDKRLWVENESGIFLFDNTTHEWTRVADQGTQMIGVGDEQMIIAGEAWLAVSSIDGSSGVQIVTTQDGQKWVWGQDGWARYEAPSLAPPFSPELVKALQDNGLSVSPDDLCLWEGTEGATVQCLTLNPEAVPELAGILRDLTNVPSWLGTWNAKKRTPSKYATFGQYEAMLKSNPLLPAHNFEMVWHPPANIRLSRTGGAWQAASEFVYQGQRIGNEAMIDTRQVGLELVDWHQVQDQDEWIALTAGVMIKQEFEPIEGETNVWRVVWRIARTPTKTEAIPDYGDVEHKMGILLPDPTSSLDENAKALDQSMRWIKRLLGFAVKDPKTSLSVSGSGEPYVQFAKVGTEGDLEEMTELQQGLEFFSPGK